MVITSIYTFLVWLIMFLFQLLPMGVAIGLSIGAIMLLLHIVTIYSSFGRLIIHTGAMGSKRIFAVEEEESMTPTELYHRLVLRAIEAQENKTFVNRQYRNTTMGSFVSNCTEFDDIGTTTSESVDGIDARRINGSR